MYLKKLEISGFKSFASKTTLDFLPSCETKEKKPARIAAQSIAGGCGVTAIVGPNGSGKSNIADAMRWAIGEQSMKNLRGKKAEDVIFAGSGKKARLGSAHVSLFFDNSDKKFPLDFSEISVSRKIFRSGESEYLINGSRVRLQDLVDILAKAGIGRENYSIVNQGMADAVLNASPLERRAIIEEAAGVKQYQIKKERSLRKLELTEDNLEKAQGLVEEIKPHLKSLKRQAEKSVQGEKISNEMKEKQFKLFSFLWKNFQEEKSQINENKEEVGRRMMNVQREVDKLNDLIAREPKETEENSQLFQLDNELREKRNKLNQLEKEKLVLEARIEIEEEKQKNKVIMQEIKQEVADVDIQYIKEGIKQITEDQERLIGRINSAEKIEDLQDIKEFARSIYQRLFDLKGDIEKGKKESLAASIIVPKKTEEEKESESESQIILELKEKIEKVAKEMSDLENEIIKIEKEIEEAIRADKEKRHTFFETERTLRSKQNDLNNLKDKFNEAKISLAKIEVREEDLKAEVEKDLKIKPEELTGKENLQPEELEREISKLKYQLEQIGGIDPLIVEEYRETNERFEFLSREISDLEKAILSLKEVIKEMDQKIDSVFDTTFDEINKEFSKYFRIIFGGGNARLSKVAVKSRRSRIKEAAEEENENKEDIIEEEKEKSKDEIGIDIFASPPGKKISGLAMLSGGERSLTSLALLFSIISHNPPPFSVLDEVEAALDEANSRRFGRIIQELSSKTQFVIISHNRETMRQASLLYGVTMGEDGISKLLSVRLDQVGQGGKIVK
ncbi:MAG: hypothetical protein COU40_01430 [Candidatus Moranbacteria bacterium CG10_big_fil_rev_8_21_14_0_10_35_21]|nr:MAG: hypothetical protein COU40_01430 [Candidatus Moranbacteria bacterium CG10_big_fil_rev_8_21_14_0_10_35_21]